MYSLLMKDRSTVYIIVTRNRHIHFKRRVYASKKAAQRQIDDDIKWMKYWLKTEKKDLPKRKDNVAWAKSLYIKEINL